MKLRFLKNFICVDVILVEYVEGDVEGKEIYRCHSIDIPINYYDRVVMALHPNGDYLHILLEPER